MNAKELAAKLNGREYTHEITEAEIIEARYSGLVVVFGGSDDLVEIRGIIDGEQGAPGTIHLTPEGLLLNECGSEDCPYFNCLKEKAATIESLWCSDPDYSFTYKTDIIHETFEIVEDEGKYCRGIVFALADVAFFMK